MKTAVYLIILGIMIWMLIKDSRDKEKERQRKIIEDNEAIMKGKR
jgi:hypothetical protein